MRLACLLGGLEFDDDRFEFAQFPEIKQTTPYLAVPVMSVDGKSFAQSNALLRYIGKETGLYPECSKQALQVDEVVDTLEDFLQCCFRYRGKDKDMLKEERVKLAENDFPRYIGGLEKRLATFGDGPYVIGDKVSIGDVVLVNNVNNFKSGFLDFVDKDMFESYPRIMEIYQKVMNEPKVVEWYKKHPIPNVSVPVSE